MALARGSQPARRGERARKRSHTARSLAATACGLVGAVGQVDHELGRRHLEAARLGVRVQRLDQAVGVGERGGIGRGDEHDEVRRGGRDASTSGPMPGGAVADHEVVARRELGDRPPGAAAAPFVVAPHRGRARAGRQDVDAAGPVAARNRRSGSAPASASSTVKRGERRRTTFRLARPRSRSTSRTRLPARARCTPRLAASRGLADAALAAGEQHERRGPASGAGHASLPRRNRSASLSPVGAVQVPRHVGPVAEEGERPAAVDGELERPARARASRRAW